MSSSDPCHLGIDVGTGAAVRGALAEAGIEPRRIREAYLGQLNGFLTHLHRACEASRIDYVQVDTSTSIDVVLTGFLAKRMALARR